MDESQYPGAGFRAIGPEACRCTPDREEGVLHGVLGETGIAHDAQREAVGSAAEAIVERAERGLVAAGDQGKDRLVGQECQVQSRAER